MTLLRTGSLRSRFGRSLTTLVVMAGALTQACTASTTDAGTATTASELSSDTDTNANAGGNASDGDGSAPRPPACFSHTPDLGGECMPLDALRRLAGDACRGGGAVVSRQDFADECGDRDAFRSTTWSCCPLPPPRPLGADGGAGQPPPPPPGSGDDAGGGAGPQPPPPPPPGACRTLVLGNRITCEDNSDWKSAVEQACSLPQLVIREVQLRGACGDDASHVAQVECCLAPPPPPDGGPGSGSASTASSTL